MLINERFRITGVLNKSTKVYVFLFPDENL